MPKSLFVDPKEVRKAGFVHFEDIPVNQYNKTLAEEKKIYTKADFMRIYRDMATIREFETMLNDIKTKSAYNGVEYNNPGPAHLSMGQEASAVGQAYILDENNNPVIDEATGEAKKQFALTWGIDAAKEAGMEGAHIGLKGENLKK